MSTASIKYGTACPVGLERPTPNWHVCIIPKVGFFSVLLFVGIYDLLVYFSLYSFNTYFLSIYYVPDTILDTVYTA